MVMSVTAFNTPNYPQAYPFEGFTLEWFGKLWEHRLMMEGLQNSFIIGIGVVVISVPIGPCRLDHHEPDLSSRPRSFLSGHRFAAPHPRGDHRHLHRHLLEGCPRPDGLHKATFYKGIVLSILGQSSFVAAYCLLIIMARLTRFDRRRKRRPSILAPPIRRSSGMCCCLPEAGVALGLVIAFLSSFENFNTTTFAILADKTLVTVLAGEARQGTTPVLSALAVIIIGLSLLGALTYEVLKRREEAIAERIKENARLAERGEAV